MTDEILYFVLLASNEPIKDLTQAKKLIPFKIETARNSQKDLDKLGGEAIKEIVEEMKLNK